LSDAIVNSEMGEDVYHLFHLIISLLAFISIVGYVNSKIVINCQLTLYL